VPPLPDTLARHRRPTVAMPDPVHPPGLVSLPHDSRPAQAVQVPGHRVRPPPILRRAFLAGDALHAGAGRHPRGSRPGAKGWNVTSHPATVRPPLSSAVVGA
jgi:hypothetical protein